MVSRDHLRRAGPVLLVFGALVALFLVFEFIVSGVVADRNQQSLIGDFKSGITNGTLAAATGGTPSEGDPVALLDIPSLGVTEAVVEGTRPQDLKAGPGHLSGSPMPGEFGNVVILGRRTTYGGPFRNIDRLGPGDGIEVTTAVGSFVYRVSAVHRTDAGQADPINGTQDSRLTLVTSDPAYLPNGRLSVVAMLRGAPLDVATAPQPTIDVAELGLASDQMGLVLAILWSAVLAVVAWVAVRIAHRWPGRVRVTIVAPIVVAVVVLLFQGADILLPGTT